MQQRLSRWIPFSEPGGWTGADRLKCTKVLGKFIGFDEEEAEALYNANGMLSGKVVDKGYLNAARRALGLKPGRGAVMRVGTQTLGSIVTPQEMIEEGAEEGDEK